MTLSKPDKAMTIRQLIDVIGAAQVATRLEVSPDTVRAWRLGRRHPGTRTMRRALCALARVRYDTVEWTESNKT